MPCSYHSTLICTVTHTLGPPIECSFLYIKYIISSIHEFVVYLHSQYAWIWRAIYSEECTWYAHHSIQLHLFTSISCIYLFSNKSFLCLSISAVSRKEEAIFLYQYYLYRIDCASIISDWVDELDSHLWIQVVWQTCCTVTSILYLHSHERMDLKNYSL